MIIQYNKSSVVSWCKKEIRLQA